MAAKNCWNLRNAEEKSAEIKVKEMGVCPANPHHGRDCWMGWLGHFAEGKVQEQIPETCNLHVCRLVI